MSNGSRARPASFAPGMTLSDYYRVEGPIRLAEGRIYYLVNDHRPDRKTRRCWECGNEDNPSSAPVCRECGASLATRRFLLSSRWDRSTFEPYLAFFQKQINHPALLAPCDVFPYPDESPNQVCSVVPYNNETLLLDEAAPLPIERVVNFAQRAIGMLALLCRSGVRLTWLHRANFLIRPSGEIMLFDPDVASVSDEPLPPEEAYQALTDLGGILRRYTPLEERTWQELFGRVEAGEFTTPAEFGQALMRTQQPRLRAPRTRHAGMTDVGLVRSLNEDNWGWVRLAEGVDLFAVADGMGGHDSGEVASRMAIETLAATARQKMAEIPEPNPEHLQNVLYESFQAANNHIKSSAEQRGNDMGTTMVAVLVLDDKLALWANVGDSRGYIYRGEALTQVTRDHSLVARMVEQNRITPEEARHHPHSNILLKTVGTERDVSIDLFETELEPGDRLVLCSDGLWGEVEDDRIEALLREHGDNRIASRELVREAHVGGGKDNITVIVVGVPTERPPAAVSSGDFEPSAPSR